MTLYMGIVVYAPALALSAVTGIHFTGAVVSIGLVCSDDSDAAVDDDDSDDGSDDARCAPSTQLWAA